MSIQDIGENRLEKNKFLTSGNIKSAFDKAVDVPAETFWQWFQLHDTDKKDDYIAPSGKNYASMGATEAEKVISGIGLPFSSYIYRFATNLNEDRRMNGSAFIRYIMLLNNQHSEMKNLRGQILAFNASSPYLPKMDGNDVVFSDNGGSANTYNDIDTDIITTPDYNIMTSWESGDFYCEHTAFILNQLAAKAGSSFIRDDGEPLVGFLHIPAAQDKLGNPNRFDDTIAVMAEALRGYWLALRTEPTTQNGIKILLTGFKNWITPKTEDAFNISGDYVKDSTNIDETMKRAFGKFLVKGKSVKINTPAGTALRYFVQGGLSPDKIISVDILTKRLAIDDTAINGEPASLQKAVELFQPHAAISLGMSMQEHFRISNGVENTNLIKTASGYKRSASDATDAYINFSLEKAIKKGWDLPNVS